MNLGTKRGRMLSRHRVALIGSCATLLALGCGGSESGEDTPSALAPSAPTPVREPAPVDVPVDPAREPSAPIAEVPAPEPAAPEEPAPEEPVPAQPEPPRVCNDSISLDDVFGLVESDLSAEGDDGLFLRYLSLGNRLNQGICAEDLGPDRVALMKTINSLSNEVGLATPEPIDDAGIVYRIDLRDIGWDQPTNVDGVDFADKWEAILAASPYAIEFEGGDADDAKLASGTTVPWLFADALIDAASVDNLYYALLDIGATEDELLAQLAIEPGDVDIAVGVGSSRLSRQDMVAERLERGDFQGYYWSRKDLAAETGGQSIFANPLDFAQDTIASIFTLPNGLYGYALFDGAGVRIEDTDVIVDAAQRDGRMRNSVSCSQCHAGGLNPMTDEVRAFVEANRFDFDGDTLDDVFDVFVEQPEIDAQIEADTLFYQAALGRVGVDPTQPEPISATYLRFDNDVTLEVAAGELGVTPAELRDNLAFVADQGDPTITTLADSTLRREQFDGIYLATLCAISGPSDNRPAVALCDALGL